MFSCKTVNPCQLWINFGSIRVSISNFGSDSYCVVVSDQMFSSLFPTDPTLSLLAKGSAESKFQPKKT